VRTNRDRKRVRKQVRRAKLLHLRKRLAAAKDQEERDVLIGKIRRVSPRAPIPED